MSSNPSFNPRERFPTESWSDQQIESFFTTRFDHSDQASHFWRVVDGIAGNLLGRPARPGHDYALTEVVRCKSWREKGVQQALDECVSRYLARTLEVAGAKVIVALGKKARSTIAAQLRLPTEFGLHGPLRLGDRNSYVLALGHPSSGQRKKPTFEEVRAVQMLF